MSVLSFGERVRGCLIGSMVGAEFGYAYVVLGRGSSVHTPQDIFSLEMSRAEDYTPEQGRMGFANSRLITDLGISAYVGVGGRVTPEGFAQLFKEDSGVSAPAFCWDGLHTTQEVLKEGMHPRISGIGAAPSGLICAAMPAVGIYHFGDPEYAYLDGVELASVTQPRIGADWAGLCAAAIACAFDPETTPNTIVDTTLKIAHQNNKDLYYATNYMMKQAKTLRSDSEDAFLQWWYYTVSGLSWRKEDGWIAPNPMQFILPLLEVYSGDIGKLMQLLIVPGHRSAVVSPIIAGAIFGAMNGAQAFPEEWRQWAEPAVSPWLGIAEVARERASTERDIISVVDELSCERPGGDSLLLDKIHGCLLAGAIGNAMGSPFEGQLYWEIDQKHPGGVQSLLDPSCVESEDDNQMAMHLVEAYLEREGLPVMARHFGEVWKRDLRADHYFQQCMGHAYDLIMQGWDQRITGHWTWVTGSTVMCVEPVGMYHLADPEFAVIDATAISYMYQRGRDVTAAAILAVAVAEALKPSATVASVCQAALEAAPKTKLNSFDERKFDSAYGYLEACLAVADKYDDVLAARKELYDECLLYHMVDPLELLGFALAMFKIAKGEVREAAVGGASIGRDADSIAGRAAMLAGTLNGAGNVPREWIDMVNPASLARIRGNAARLAEFISGKKLGRLRRRQEMAQEQGYFRR